MVTFQIALVSDFEKSFVLYLYGEFHIKKLISALTIGHSAADFISYENVEFSSSDSYIHMDTQTGNTGKIGQWMFDISSEEALTEAESSCIQWAKKQEETTLWTEDLMSCPCTKQQANQDWRYSFDQSLRQNCAIFLPSNTESTVECCYDEQGSLIKSTEETGSIYLRYHPVFHPDAYQANDRDPFVHCCEESTNCEAFKFYRPSANCIGYTPPLPSKKQ